MSGAPLGQRPTISDAACTGVVPSASAAVAAKSQNAGTSWRRRRHTRYEPRRAHAGKAAAAGAGASGSIGSWRGSPSTT